MKNLNIFIDYVAVSPSVERLTANISKQKRNTLQTVTEDDEELMQFFFTEVCAELGVLLNEYSSCVVGVDDVKFAFKLPANWDDTQEDVLVKRLTDAVVYGILAKWYGMSEESNYNDIFAGTVGEILSVINKRVKPERDGGK